MPVAQPPRPRRTRPLASSSIVPLPPPEPIDDIAGPFSFWGSIYDFDGHKIATGFAGPDEDKVVVANAVEGYKRPAPQEYVEDDLPTTRTFVGAYQPSWRLGRNPIIKEPDERGRSRRIRNNVEGEDSTTRWFVGKEYLLYYPVVAYSRDLRPQNPFSDLSSLSSLSDDSDVEVDVKTASPSQGERSNPKP